MSLFLVVVAIPGFRRGLKIDGGFFTTKVAGGGRCFSLAGDSSFSFRLAAGAFSSHAFPSSSSDISPSSAIFSKLTLLFSTLRTRSSDESSVVPVGTVSFSNTSLIPAIPTNLVCHAGSKDRVGNTGRSKMDGLY